MSSPPADGGITVPRRELLRGLGIAVAVATVVLVVAVLPAELGIDPTGAGRALGLTALRPAPAAPQATTPAAGPAAPATGTQAGRQHAPYRADTREVVLPPGKGLEVKTRLEKGGALVYSWSTAGGEKVDHEFHGEPLGAKNDEFESFIRDAGVSESRGHLIAPFTGTHGWYWKNRTAKPVTIRLQASGNYLDLFEP